ncbi:MAG: amidase [Solirubrobacteraceae bacterium]
MSPLREQLELLRNGTASSHELVTESLQAIDGASALNAFRCTRRDAALVEAQDADRRRSSGEDAPLLGVPIAIKDDTDLDGETTEFGCAGDHIARRADAEVVRRLKAAGAVIVGKTTTPELGQWPFTEGRAFGITRNPWNPAHSPGGSSGGSAAAVAAGLVPAAIGSDGAGSVRIPAAWTHLVGIKPQRGRISTWPDAEAFNGLTVLGPLARTVADAALLLDAVTGNHANELHRPPAFSERLADAAQSDPRPLRIALSTRIPFSGPPARLDPRIRGAVHRLGEVLAGLGHTVEEADPSYGLVGLSFVPRSTAGVREWTRRLPDLAALDPRTRENARTGALLRGPALRLARAIERPLRAQIGRIFRRYDIVLAPTTAQPAFPVGTFDGLSNWQTDLRMIAACPFCWPWNVIGWPAINIPAGRVDGELPIGASLLGPAHSEPLLVSLAAQLEAAQRWERDRPAPIAA